MIRFGSLAELRRLLGDKLAARIKLTGEGEDLFIQASREIPYGYVVGIMALLQGTGGGQARAGDEPAGGGRGAGAAGRGDASAAGSRTGDHPLSVE